jgi:hypothetical protein
MSKRALAALLWFATIWVGYEIVWSMTGVPRMVGPVLAFVVSALVTTDPFGLFWSADADPTVAPVRASSIEQTSV